MADQLSGNQQMTTWTILSGILGLVSVFLSLCGVVEIIRRRDSAHCTRCGYNLKGLSLPRCPECGAKGRGAHHVKRKFRGASGKLALGVTLAYGAHVCARFPQNIPTWLLIRVAPVHACSVYSSPLTQEIIRRRFVGTISAEARLSYAERVVSCAIRDGRLIRHPSVWPSGSAVGIRVIDEAELFMLDSVVLHIECPPIQLSVLKDPQTVAMSQPTREWIDPTVQVPWVAWKSGPMYYTVTARCAGIARRVGMGYVRIEQRADIDECMKRRDMRLDEFLGIAARAEQEHVIINIAPREATSEVLPAIGLDMEIVMSGNIVGSTSYAHEWRDACGRINLQPRIIRVALSSGARSKECVLKIRSNPLVTGGLSNQGDYWHGAACVEVSQGGG